MAKQPKFPSEMVRLPSEVADALRRKAARRGVTVTQIAREAFFRKRATMTTDELIRQAYNRLSARQAELSEELEEAGEKPELLERAIDALGELYQTWQDIEAESDDGEDEEDEEDEAEEEDEGDEEEEDDAR